MINVNTSTASQSSLMPRWERVDLPSTSCLDGSPAAFFYRRPIAGSNSTTTKFVLYPEGGGWCFSPVDCVARTQTDVGTSSNYPSTSRAPGGGAGYFYDPAGNPSTGTEFMDGAVVHLKYCDGASFAGSSRIKVLADYEQLQMGKRELPEGSRATVTFGGRAILEAALTVLMSPERPFGMRHATHVLLSGCSAGGLAALLSAEVVRQRVVQHGAPLRHFKVAVFSGVFYSPESSPYTQQMRASLRWPHECAAGVHSLVPLQRRAVALRAWAAAARGATT